MKNLIKILIIGFLSIIISESHAQHGGFKFGLNMANANTKEFDEVDHKFLFAPRIGFIFETPLYEGLFLQTGIFTTVSGYKFNFTRFIDEGYEEKDSKEMFVLLYVEFPVNIGYKHELKDDLYIFGMAGPVFRLLTYSTLAYKIGDVWDNEVTHVGEDYDKVELFDNFDFGLNIEAGVQVHRWEFSIFYNPCFTNILNEDLDVLSKDAKWKNYSFGVNFAILIGNMDK